MAFEQECAKNGCVDTSGVSETGFYFWGEFADEWAKVTDMYTLDVLQKYSKAHMLESVFVGWNIVITLDTGEVIKTNSEPVSMDDVQEAINTLLKPSFFGKRIVKFEIVAE